ncbi:hypothetical protein [Nocardia carnea]|uniref:hypothetical protein n=1 Tax=Nocardia carnea TaxID=37328 RepID=UPI002457A15F|nr:hypothetical protein [Nocardia carnea]
MDHTAPLLCDDPDCSKPAEHMTSAPKSNGQWVLLYLCKPHYREIAHLLKQAKDRMKAAQKRQPRKEGELPALWELA